METIGDNITGMKEFVKRKIPHIISNDFSTIKRYLNSNLNLF